MKIRTGFVTNSSSSSFILSYRELPQLPEELVKQYPELESYQEFIHTALEDSDSYGARFDEDTCVRLTCKEDVDAYFREHFVEYGSTFSTGTGWSCSLEEYLNETPADKALYENILARLEAGEHVLVRKVPYDRKGTMKLIRGLVKAGKVENLLERES